MNESWALLNQFESVVEARVVESFLRAQGFEVQLLDTHTPIHRLMPFRGAGSGLRLMVRTQDEAKARELLRETQKGFHLEIVGELQPIEKSRAERWIFVFLILLAALVYFAGKFA